MYRTGFGIDFHRFAEGRKLWIGGIEIPHHKGSLGHSDADVLLHAICDAMLGALALGDIGVHFPDTDPANKDIDSKILLKKCHNIISQKGYEDVIVESTVCLEMPKLNTYTIEMRVVIAGIFDIGADNVNIQDTYDR